MSATTKSKIKAEIGKALDLHGIAILPPLDAGSTLRELASVGIHGACTILDPWYNKGFGGAIDRLEYDRFIINLLDLSAEVSPHIYLWGFPEIVARYVDEAPHPFELEAWLTWYYKNNPSVIRGWRSAQNACLHFKSPEGVMHPEHFLNEKQLDLKKQGKLRYMPGPTSVIDDQFTDADHFDHVDDVIETALLVGFVGKKEQTGHPSQKPIAVYDRIVRMATVEREIVIDPMAGSGTTGAVCQRLGRRAILGDVDPAYIKMMEDRLGVKRLDISFA